MPEGRREPPKLKPSDLSIIAEEGEVSNVEDLLRNVSGSQMSEAGEVEKSQPEHEEQDAGQSMQAEAVEQRPHELTEGSSKQLVVSSAAELRDQQLTAQTLGDEPEIQQQSVSAVGPSTSTPANRRSRPKSRVPRYLRYHGRDIRKLQTVSEDDLNRVIELLRTPVAARRLFIQKQMKFRRQWFQNMRKRQPKQKVVTVMPNSTACAKRVFSIQEDNPNGKTIARGFCHLFTPNIMADLTDEDKVLGKLKKARRADDFKAFKRVDSCIINTGLCSSTIYWNTVRLQRKYRGSTSEVL